MQEYTNRAARRVGVPSRFPVLRTLSTVALVGGWILIVAGGIGFLYSVVMGLESLGQESPFGEAGAMFAFGAMVPSLVAMVVGFFSVLWGEITKVFMGIEQNTFHMVEQRGEYERRLQQQGEGEAA